MISKTWKLSFHIKPFRYVNGWGSILHGMVKPIRDESRYPGVWFWSQTTKLHICSYINGHSYYTCYNSKDQLPLDKFSEIAIQQLLVDNQYRYRITINGLMVYDVVNTQPASFTNVEYYAGNPWYTPANAVIGNLKINDKFIV